jgi:aminomethyltransferase
VIVIKTWISISLKIGRYETNSLPAKDLETSKLCEVYNWSLWQNWLLADMYAPDHIQEYFAIRIACADFDMSPIPKYHIHGPDAVRFLDRIVTQDVSQCNIGGVLYTRWCDDDGKIMDDGILARLDEQSFRLTA